MKAYKVAQAASGTGLICPRRCQGRFVVNLERLREQKKEVGVTTITCPYCSKVSRIPE